MKFFISYFLLASSVFSTTVQHRPKTRRRYHWKDFKGDIPVDAFNVTENLYIGQVLHDAILVGGYYAGAGAVIVEYGGERAIIRSTIKLLCGNEENLKWRPVNVDGLIDLENLVIGGFHDGYITYIGKVFHEDQWKIGNVYPPPYQLKGLNTWYNGGGRYLAEDFEVLEYRNEEVK